MTLLDKVLAGIEFILGENGLAVKTIEGFKFNLNQVEYAKLVARGFLKFDEKTGLASINIQEAATGTGKTLGFLIPLLLINTYTEERVAVSTHTKQLQNQILEKDYPNAARLVAEYTDTPLRVAKVRVGITNYISARACALHRDRLIAKSPVKFAEAIEFLNAAIAWLEAGILSAEPCSGILLDFMELQNLDNLPTGITANDIHLTHKSLSTEKKKYEADKFESKNADLLICNHTLVAQHAYRWNSILDIEGNEMKYLVIDEADQFASAAEMVIGSDLSLHMVLKNTEDAEVAKTTIKAITAFYDYVTSMDIPANDLMVMGVDEEFSKLFMVAYETMKASAKKVHAEIEKGGLPDETFTNYREFMDSFEDVSKTYKAYLDNKNKVIINWSPKKKYPSIRVSKHQIGDIISRLFSHTKKAKTEQEIDEMGVSSVKTYLKGILFTSATISNPDKSDKIETFDLFASTVGIIRFCKKGTTEPIHNVQVGLYSITRPALNFGKMHIVLADARAPNPVKDEMTDDGVIYVTDEDYLDYAAMGIKKAIEVGGGVLVLTQSWKDTEALAKRLEGTPNLIVHQKGEPLAILKKKFVATPDAVMITPSGWSGLDMPGKVRHNVITRIPFAPIDKQKEELAKMVWLAQGKDITTFEAKKWSNLSYQAHIKLIQGIGRGIRSATDEVTWWMLDPRFPRPEKYSVKAVTPEEVEITVNKKASYNKFRKTVPHRFELTSYANANILKIDGSMYK